MMVPKKKKKTMMMKRKTMAGAGTKTMVGPGTKTKMNKGSTYEMEVLTMPHLMLRNAATACRPPAYFLRARRWPRAWASMCASVAGPRMRPAVPSTHSPPWPCHTSFMS